MLMIKQYGVWIALAFTLTATAWVSQLEESDDAVGLKSNVLLETEGANSVIKSQRIASAANSIAIARPKISEEPKNIFTTFGVAENAGAENIAPQKSAPVNPFVYAGKVVEDGKVTVFLLDGEKSHAVNVGDVIEEIWKVKSISPPNMTLRNLPLKIEMQMEIGATS